MTLETLENVNRRRSRKKIPKVSQFVVADQILAGDGMAWLFPWIDYREAELAYQFDQLDRGF